MWRFVENVITCCDAAEGMIPEPLENAQYLRILANNKKLCLKSLTALEESTMYLK